MATVHSTVSPLPAREAYPPAEVWYVTRRHGGHAVDVVSPLYETREQAAGFLALVRKRQPGGDYGLTMARSEREPHEWVSPVFMRDGSVVAAREVSRG